MGQQIEFKGDKISPKPLWRRIARQIEEDILTGRIGPDSPFPLIKELAHTFGANYRTLRRALDHLESRGLISAGGRRMKAFRHAPGRRNTVQLFLPESHGGGLSLHYLDPGNLRIIETLFQEANVSLQIVFYSPRRGKTRYRLFPHGTSWDTFPDSLLGALWIVFDPADVATDLCVRLANRQFPVAVHDASSALAFPPFFLNAPRIALFSDPDTGRPSEIVGRYLVRLGHRHIAFVSAPTDAAWHRGRVEGLSRIFNRSGRTLEVIMDPDGGSDGSSRARFEKALKLKPVTAWVLPTDNDAIPALAFLRKRDVAVPERISVVGFDNSLAAVANRITSYHDNSDAMLRAAVDYILRPGSFRDRRASAIREMYGFVVERESSGPAGG